MLCSYARAYTRPSVVSRSDIHRELHVQVKLQAGKHVIKEHSRALTITGEHYNIGGRFLSAAIMMTPHIDSYHRQSEHIGGSCLFENNTSKVVGLCTVIVNRGRHRRPQVERPIIVAWRSRQVRTYEVNHACVIRWPRSRNYCHQLVSCTISLRLRSHRINFQSTVIVHSCRI